jgi:hypothetical protein
VSAVAGAKRSRFMETARSENEMGTELKHDGTVKQFPIQYC